MNFLACAPNIILLYIREEKEKGLNLIGGKHIVNRQIMIIFV